MPVTCPAGPFDPPEALDQMDVCTGFDFMYNYNEGPTWVASQGAFYFSNFVQGAQGEVFDGHIIKYTPGGDCEVAFDVAGTNGLARSADGNLLGASHLTRSISHYNLATKEVTIVADMYMASMLDSPNDLIEHANGSIYFTNPTYEVGERVPGFGRAVFRIDPLGVMSLIDQPGNEPNGIALSPAGDKLYVVNSGVYDLDAQGVPSDSATQMDLNADGLGVDCAGNVYRSGGTIQGSDGQQVGNFPGGTNLAFGGADQKTLLVVHDGASVRVVTMNVPGLP
jgi:gluconolactonase